MAEFDIVIHGGRLIDGTGNPWFYGDLGIKQGRIACVGKIGPEAGQRAISAKGCVVTPGYIDMHTHSDQPLVADGNAESKVRQGVTLDIIGESQTVAPLEGAILEEYRAEHRKRNGIETDWTTFTGYFESLIRSMSRRGFRRSRSSAWCAASRSGRRAAPSRKR
jgi:N-acyl-D-aspartate/D-glutamate deacylase